MSAEISGSRGSSRQQQTGQINPAFLDIANTVGQQLLPGAVQAGSLLPQLLDPNFASSFIESRGETDTELRRASVGAFEETALPTIQNQAALSGFGNSPAVAEVAGGALAQALPGLIQVENQQGQFQDQLSLGIMSLLSGLAQNILLQPLTALGPPATGTRTSGSQNQVGGKLSSNYAPK